MLILRYMLGDNNWIKTYDPIGSNSPANFVTYDNNDVYCWNNISYYDKS